MSSYILYNSVNPFLGVSPTPLVTRQETYNQAGERWAQIQVITLRGQITGKCDTFQQLVNKQNQIISGFSKDFQTLQIYDGATLAYSTPYVRVTDIAFDQSNYTTLVPYAITLECYPQQFFSGTYGVLNPNEQVDYQYSQDGIVTISHTISAQGFTNNSLNSNALDNARMWVQSRSGWSLKVAPKFINSGVVTPYLDINPCLKEFSEEIDRFNGTYSITEKYTTDTKFSGIGILRYTTDFQSGITDNFSTVTVKGSIDGCRYQNMSDIRLRYQQFDSYGVASGYYYNITHLSDLNKNPVASGVGENNFDKKLTFSVAFTNDQSPDVEFKYRTQMDYDYDTDLIAASIDGEITSKGPLKKRWEKVLSYYQTGHIDLYALVLPDYYTFAADVDPRLTGFPLNPHPTSSGDGQNEYEATISMHAGWNSKPIAPTGFDKFEYTISYTPAIHQFSASPCLDGMGQYNVYDLGYKTRATIGIDVQTIISPTVNTDQGLAAVKAQIAQIRSTYFSGDEMALTSQRLIQGNKSFNKSIGASATFTADQAEFSF